MKVGDCENVSLLLRIDDSWISWFTAATRGVLVPSLSSKGGNLVPGTKHGHSASGRMTDDERFEAPSSAVRKSVVDDIRLDDISRVLAALKRGELSARTSPSARDDALDAIMSDLNELADKLAEGKSDPSLRHPHQMEAIGTLAGGVAHAMNNVLAVVLGLSAVLEEEMIEHPAWREDLGEIMEAAQRGRSIVQNMLGFAGKGAYRKERINLNATVDALLELLGPTLPQNVHITADLSDQLGYIEGDPNQLSQVVMNLCRNASDAVSNGGTIRISTWDCVVTSDTDELTRGLPPGPYAVLEVHDDGVGMDEESLRRAFEPFFTTKDIGQGSGLGLAMVYGAVTEQGGVVRLASRPGEGTTARVLLPISAPRTRQAVPVSGFMSTAARARIVLVVDDEPMLLSVARRVLERRGDHAILALGGQEAIRIFREQHAQIDVVLLDLVMPDLDGIECLRRLKDIDPEARVLLCTGYPGSVGRKFLDDNGASGLLHKPYTVQQLCEAVDAVDQRARSAAS
jgi:two-component system, cell cycle sensor histidine kinase and response regulator CckA